MNIVLQGILVVYNMKLKKMTLKSQQARKRFLLLSANNPGITIVKMLKGDSFKLLNL